MERYNTESGLWFEVRFSELEWIDGSDDCISIWMDDTMISNPNVNSAITDGVAIISGNFTQEVLLRELRR